MKLSPLKCSLLALALVTAPVTVFAASATSPGALVVAQADDEMAAPAEGGKRIEAIRKFLAGGKNLSKLPIERLNQRLKRAQALQSTKGLSGDLMQGLQDEEQQIAAEISRRNGASAPEPEASGNNSPAEPAQDASTPADGAGAKNVSDFIASARPAAELQNKELRQQTRQAQQLMKSAGLQKDQRQKLRQIAREGRAEMEKRQSGKTAGGGDTPVSPSGNTNSTTNDVTAFLQSAKPVAGLGDEELRQQTRQATTLMKTEGLSREDRQKLRDMMRQGRAEIQKRGTAKPDKPAKPSRPVDDTGTDNAAPEKKPVTPATPASPPGSEQKAKDILADQSDVSAMNNKDLRNRLETIRELLASKDVSPESKKALRTKLNAEKTLLRDRVAKDEGDRQNTLPEANRPSAGGDGSVVNKDTIKVVVADRRPSRELKDAELRLRVNVFRIIINDRTYSERERLEWRGILERDRAFLRERMLAERRRRQQDLVLGVNTGKLNIRIGLNFEPNRPPPPRAIFAAEAADEEIEEILAAPPRRPVERRYTVEEVETSPDLRDSVARIELDTVHFGFGEGFLREEEIGNLDRIAEIMEKILAAHPGEVFMIEGHTDAVGDDAANLELSRERAKAVKEALITYFVIPPENLKTVGFGEKYLKIPTPEAEAENRRVSVARITALVGALND